MDSHKVHFLRVDPLENILLLIISIRKYIEGICNNR